MNGDVEALAEVLAAHSIRGYGSCSCGVEYHYYGRYSADHRRHVAAVLAAHVRAARAEDAARLAAVEALVRSWQTAATVLRTPDQENGYLLAWPDGRAQTFEGCASDLARALRTPDAAPEEGI